MTKRAHESFTTESIGKNFQNRFDLVNYAIKVAEDLLLRGHRGPTFLDLPNYASQVLAEIEEGRDLLQEDDEDDQEGPLSLSESADASPKEDSTE